MSTSITNQSHPPASLPIVALLRIAQRQRDRRVHAVSGRCRFGKPLPQLSLVATPGADSAQISPLTRHAEERGKIVERDQSISVNEMPDREHDGCDTGGPKELAFEV